jgi:hypothetical protein
LPDTLQAFEEELGLLIARLSWGIIDVKILISF